MATPMGHLAVGLAWGLAVDRDRATAGRLGWAACCAAAADLDFVPGILLGEPARFHHGATHSLLAMAVLTVGVLGFWGRRSKLGVYDWVLVGGAFGTHLLLDWLTHDPGIRQGLPLLWPWSGVRFLSPIWLIPAVRRAWPPDAPWLAHTLWLSVVEVALTLPLVLGAWIVAGCPRPLSRARDGGRA